MNDFKFAFRQMSKHKGSSLLAVLILALGIGGTTAVFSVADKVLLNPIPGRDTDRLVSLREVEPRRDRDWHMSAPVIEEISRHTEFIETLAYYHLSPREKKVELGGKVVKLTGAIVSPNFFDLLELRSHIGRTFVSGDGNPNAAKTIIINHGLWMRRFGGDPEVIGQTLELDEVAYSIIGVMPSNVQFPFGSGYNEFWLPHTFITDDLNSDLTAWIPMARLSEGVDPQEFQSMLDVVGPQRTNSEDKEAQPMTLQFRPARWSLSPPVLQKTMWTLLAMMGVLLLIACANVGNLMLSRMLGRRGEIGVRMAVGAGRLSIGRQLLVESLLLAGIAAALGIFIAWAGIIALEQFYLNYLPRIQVIGLDWQVLGITCGISVAAGLLFGTVPAMLAACSNVNHVLKESEERHSGGFFQRTFHNGLVVFQVCLAVVLLTGSYSMIGNVVKLLQKDPGLEAKGLYRVFYDGVDFMNGTGPYDVQAAMDQGVPESEAIDKGREAKLEQINNFRRIALERLQAVPGVESVGKHNWGGSFEYEIKGRANPVHLGSATVGVVSGDYLRTLGAELVTGRMFTRDDVQPGEQGVVINEEMASTCWPDESPLGKQFSDGDGRNEYQVIGVIRNISDWALDSEAKPLFYQPYERLMDSLRDAFRIGVGEYYLRSSLEPEQLRVALVEAGEEMMVSVELRDFNSIEAQLHRSLAPRRVMMWLLVTLSALALLLSALGLYAVLAYAVSRRIREVGIRMAMGAGREQVRDLFLLYGLKLFAAGILLGTVLAISVTRSLESLLFGISLADPWILCGVALTLGGAGFLASFLPAHRAAKVGPMEALRHE